MAGKSKIEWTETTWNPTRGCDQISPGCKHCYAKTWAERFRGTPGHAYERGFDPRLVPQDLGQPVRWTDPHTIFVNSMSDLFHDAFPDDYIEDVVQAMCDADWHTYQVLTKRSERMRDLLAGRLRFAAQLPHIWWGVSVENNRHGVPRIDDLRSAPAAMRFLSVEPLIEELEPLNHDGIHWVIVGGESGPGARPILKRWVTTIRDQCAAAGVPFFFKQWGGARKGVTGRQLDGAVHDAMPPLQHNPVKPAVERDAFLAGLEAKYPTPRSVATTPLAGV